MTTISTLTGYDADLVVFLVSFALLEAGRKFLRYAESKKLNIVVAALLTLVLCYVGPMTAASFWSFKFAALLAMNPIIAVGVNVVAVFLALSSLEVRSKAFEPQRVMMITTIGFFTVLFGIKISVLPYFVYFLSSFQFA